MKQLLTFGIIAILISIYGVAETSAFDSPVSPPASPVETPAPVVIPRPPDWRPPYRAPKYRPVPPYELVDRATSNDTAGKP